MKNICVFCASSIGKNPYFEKSARDLGKALAQKGMTIVYGGASVGMMDAVASAALAENGEVIGVIPKSLVDYEVAHVGLTKQHVVNFMYERKTKMIDISDAFISLPGGFGTLDEFFEVVTLNQLGDINKPCYLLNIDGFYDDLLKFMKHQKKEGLIRDKLKKSDTPHFYVFNTVDELIDHLTSL